MFLHYEGEEFWLVWSEFPTEMASARLPLESGENTSYIQISLNEKSSTQLDKKTAPCKLYKQNTEFIDCSKKQIWELLKPKINCTFAILRSIIPDNSDVLECFSLLSAWKTLEATEKVYFDFFGRLDHHNCPVPCQQRSYNIDLKYLHRNSWIEVENQNLVNEAAVLAISYTTLLVEECRGEDRNDCL